MLINPITINKNVSPNSFKSCEISDLTILVGGYVITPSGEIIIVDEKEEHCNVFSKYINSYLEKEDDKLYDISTAIKILCDLGCCIYSGIRYHEYISGKIESFDNEVISLNFPKDIHNITDVQKDICKRIIDNNKSVLGNREKIYMLYGSMPDIVYTKEQILEILNTKEKEM